MKIGTKYCGTFLDYSGYGSANRADIASLYLSGVDLVTELVTQVPERTNHGWVGELAANLQNRKIDYKIKVIHLTPDCYPQFMEEGKYHIGRLFWETDKIPDSWIEPCNKMGELWVSSPAMIEVFKGSGIKVPMYAFPQSLDTAEADKLYGIFTIPHHEGFLFYGIFQWIERKNPKGLIQTYWKTFSGRKDVSLLLKTYRITYVKEEFDQILLDIQRWKREMSLSHFPRLYITNKLLSHAQVMRLHSTGDCFISADHGEGWCRPLQEALLMGRTAITTARGGIHEYLDDTYYFPIPSAYVPVTEVSWIPYYKASQNWAEPDYEKLSETMKYVFANKQVANAKGIHAREYIKNTFSYLAVGRKMAWRLEQIQKGL